MTGEVGHSGHHTFFFVILAFILCQNAFGQTVPEEARRHLARGMAAVEMANSPEELGPALEEFQEGARLAPDWPALRYHLGLVHEKMGNLQESIASFREYLRLAPDAPDAAQIQETIYKLEYRAEQTLTVPVIIDVLVSLSDETSWQRTGDCSPNLIQFKNAHPKEDGRVSVRTGFFLFGEGDTRQTLQVRGPIFEYSFIANTCPAGAHQRDSDCFGEAAITVNVVSKNLVKSKQKPLRRDPNNYIPAGERSCTFQKYF